MPPNVWKLEAAPLFAFYGMGLQGWDASYHFLNSRCYPGDGWPGLSSYMTDTPHYIGQFPACPSGDAATRQRKPPGRGAAADHRRTLLGFRSAQAGFHGRRARRQDGQRPTADAGGDAGGRPRNRGFRRRQVDGRGSGQVLGQIGENRTLHDRPARVGLRPAARDAPRPENARHRRAGRGLATSNCRASWSS